MSENRRDWLRRLFLCGVEAADPTRATARALDDIERPDAVIAVGKAAVGMARAVRDRFGPVPGLLITNDGNGAQVPGLTLHLAAHPVPDARGAAAADAALGLAEGLGPGQRLLLLVSGGGSALLPAPVPGVSLADKAAVNAALLASGADIREMNLVRQSLSRIKGGGLARAAAPARVTALILSDVVGDDLSVIASGPTAAPIGTPAEARAALEARGLWPDLPAPVRRYLESAPPPMPVPEADNRLVGSNGQSVAAMAAAAGAGARLWPVPVEGEVSQVARALVGGAGPGLTLWGGETTVVLKGSGRGGRNQELALRIALEAEAAGWAPGWVCLCGGTDGRDGPTDAAGGLVDAGTLARIRDAGLDPVALVKANDSYRALEAAGDLLMTGPTGTNVADLGLVWRP